jgi:hypothetical protein
MEPSLAVKPLELRVSVNKSKKFLQESFFPHLIFKKPYRLGIRYFV